MNRYWNYLLVTKVIQATHDLLNAMNLHLYTFTCIKVFPYIICSLNNFTIKELSLNKDSQLLISQSFLSLQPDALTESLRPLPHLGNDMGDTSWTHSELLCEVYGRLIATDNPICNL